MRINSIKQLPVKYQRQAAEQLKAQKPVVAKSAGIGKILRANPTVMPNRTAKDAEIVSEIQFEFPLRVVSEANQHEHWTAKGKRKVAQQMETEAMWIYHVRQRIIKTPCVVTFTKFGVSELDSDNLVGSFKHVRDQVAKQLGIDDGDTSKVTYIVKQQKIKPSEHKHSHWISIHIKAVENEGI